MITDSVAPCDAVAAAAEEGMLEEGVRKVRRLDQISFFRCIAFRTWTKSMLRISKKKNLVSIQDSADEKYSSAALTFPYISFLYLKVLYDSILHLSMFLYPK